MVFSIGLYSRAARRLNNYVVELVILTAIANNVAFCFLHHMYGKHVNPRIGTRCRTIDQSCPYTTSGVPFDEEPLKIVKNVFLLWRHVIPWEKILTHVTRRYNYRLEELFRADTYHQQYCRGKTLKGVELTQLNVSVE